MHGNPYRCTCTKPYARRHAPHRVPAGMHGNPWPCTCTIPYAHRHAPHRMPTDMHGTPCPCMSANLSNHDTRRLTSPGFDWASAGRSGPPASSVKASQSASNRFWQPSAPSSVVWIIHSVTEMTATESGKPGHVLDPKEVQSCESEQQGAAPVRVCPQDP
eukprot:364353-Chlamydomonas_euryale.AAC.4